MLRPAPGTSRLAYVTPLSSYTRRHPTTLPELYDEKGPEDYFCSGRVLTPRRSRDFPVSASSCVERTLCLSPTARLESLAYVVGRCGRARILHRHGFGQLEPTGRLACLARSPARC